MDRPGSKRLPKKSQADRMRTWNQTKTKNIGIQ